MRRIERVAMGAPQVGPPSPGRVVVLLLTALVLTGDRDAFIPPRASDELASLIPGARLARIAGGTHGVNFERPAEWNAIVLGFLAEHDALLEPARAAARG